jgi:hypothetical protein
MSFSKAQTEAITLVMIAGIVISLSGAAYIWGKPLMEKRATISEFAAARTFMLALDRDIRSVANSGSGKLSAAVPSGGLKVVPFDPDDPYNKDKNAVTLEFTVSQPMVFNSSAPIDTWNLEEFGSYERDEPRIIMLSSEATDIGYVMRMSMHYRELDTSERPYKGYRIALSAAGTGGKEATVESDGSSLEAGQADNGGDLLISRVTVSSF